MAESAGIYEGNSCACLDLEECREAFGGEESVNDQ